jgi:putative transcriptional regulator
MIRVRLGYLLLDNQARLKELSEATGIAMNNLSVLKNNKARAIRFSTLEAICKALKCQPGDLLEHVEDPAQDDPLQAMGQ